jgi:tryptophanyl-tRNA synthetase
LTSELAKRKRVVSGMRPTGKLHIGHYFGALGNWVRLQEDPAYDCFYFIADWHALTSDYADTSAVAQNTIEITTDYLASGLDPEKSVIFQQSQVPEHAELHLLLSMVTPLGWLERVPTYKEALENITNKDLHTYGFLGYPCLQTADIVIYSEEGVPLMVPVGEDQVSHVELSREIVAAFNFHNGFEVEYEKWRDEDLNGLIEALYPRGGTPIFITSASPSAHAQAPVVNREVFRRQLREEGPINFAKRIGERNMKYFRLSPVLQEPQVMLTKTPRIPGLDGRKMSKSYGNAITLSESDADIRAKTKAMKTDPARQRRTDPGNPDVCPVYDWHKLFSPAETLEWAAAGCRSAGIGCIECKSKMADNLIAWIAPVRERRVEYEKHPGRVLEILDAGSKRARVEAVKTMERVREAVFGWKRKREEIHAGFTEVHDRMGEGRS